MKSVFLLQIPITLIDVRISGLQLKGGGGGVVVKWPRNGEPGEGRRERGPNALTLDCP